MRRSKRLVVYHGKLISKIIDTDTYVNTYDNQWSQQRLPYTDIEYQPLPRFLKQENFQLLSRVNTHYPHKLTSASKWQNQNEIRAIQSCPSRNHPIWSNSEIELLLQNYSKLKIMNLIIKLPPKGTDKTNSRAHPTKLTTHTHIHAII